MPINQTHFDDPGLSLGFTIVRVADGLAYDSADATFKAAPTKPLIPAPAKAAPYQRVYALALAATPMATFTDGEYDLYVHDEAEWNAGAPSLVGPPQRIAIKNGDDSTVVVLEPVMTIDTTKADSSALAAWAGFGVTVKAGAIVTVYGTVQTTPVN